MERCIPRRTPASAVCMFALITTGIAAANSNSPTIRLFPTTVVEDLRQTSSVAQEMETGLQEVIGRLDQQQQLYLESKCDGAEGDPGCQRLAKQIGATYLEMLTIMEERLPDMEHTVNNTRLSLERSLRSELGKKMTSWTLQETLIGKQGDTAAATSAPTLRGRSGMRLSERFKQYYQLVATSGSQGDQSLAVLASDIYLDMQETSDLIATLDGYSREDVDAFAVESQRRAAHAAIAADHQDVTEMSLVRVTPAWRQQIALLGPIDAPTGERREVDVAKGLRSTLQLLGHGPSSDPAIRGFG